MKIWSQRFVTAAIAVLILSPPTLYSVQPPEERRLELLERIESLKPTEAIPGVTERWFWYQAGGWLTGTFTDYHNDELSVGGTPAEAYRADTRVWAQAGVTVPKRLRDYLGHRHHVYGRLKNAYQWEHVGDNDNDGVHADMLYLHDHFEWGRFARLQTNLGRRFFTIGRGLVYSNLHDGVDGTLTLTPAALKIFYSRTLPHETNVDTSVPGFDKHYERHFFGLELEFLMLAQHRPYAFFLLTRDSSTEDPESRPRDFHYDANYYGIGTKGELFIPNLRYFGELVWERGLSIVSGTSQTENIHAYAFDTGLEYFTNIYSHPAFKLQYARGSGDEERNNVSNTSNGNEAGADKNFLYFGHFTQGGFALNARLSNIDVYKIGFTFKPLEGISESAVKNTLWEGTRDLTLGLNYYIFEKVESLGAISDLRANRNFHKIGREWDAFAAWRITSDLTWTFRWGYLHFLDAYDPDIQDETLLSTSLTVAF